MMLLPCRLPHDSFTIMMLLHCLLLSAVVVVGAIELENEMIIVENAALNEQHFHSLTTSSRQSRVRTQGDASDNIFHQGERRILGDNIFMQHDRDQSIHIGEVIVQGPPESLPPDLEVVKYLEMADLSVVRAKVNHEEDAVQELRRRGMEANENLLLRPSQMLPNDYGPDFQWHFNNIQAEQAWEVTKGSGTIVAVLDSGLLDTLPFGGDGVACIVSPFNAIDNSTNVYDDSPDRHGTFIAGIIAQTTNNAKGVAGFSYEACVMPVKVGGSIGASIGDTINGIYYAVDEGARVVNLSLGISGFTSFPPMDRALDYAYHNNVVVVAAAGNNDTLDTLDYPAVYSNVISVGATDRNNIVAPYAAGGYSPDLVAPGGDTAFNDENGIIQECIIRLNETHSAIGLCGFEGSSFACPHVAATAAMLIAAGVASTPLAIKSILTSTSLDLGEAGNDPFYGHGLLQSHNALTSSFRQAGRPKPAHP